MVDNTVLQTLKEYIKSNVASKIKLEKPNEDATQSPAYVNPVVVVGYLPPKNFLPEGYDVPAIIVGMDQGTDDGNDAYLGIRIVFATYSMGEKNEEGEMIPDMKGYIDLLHLMTQTRMAISTAMNLEKTQVRKPIKWGMYQEQPWPYWYGWMTFDATLAIINPVDRDEIKGGLEDGI